MRERIMKRKREQYCFLFSDVRRLADVYPNIERIEISFVNNHKSILDDTTEEGVMKYDSQSQAIFIVPCINPECSTIGYNLKDDINNMQRNRLTELTKDRNCEGQEAPDHPEEKCGGSLKYTIRIFYK